MTVSNIRQSHLPPAVAFGLMALAGWCGPARCEDFVLTTGGQVSGKLLNPSQDPRTAYQIQTPIGVVEIGASQVKEVIPTSARLQQYAALLPRMPATADGNWRMAKWCQENYLEDLRQTHLEKCLQYEPNHPEARRALGFSMFKGEWRLVEVINRRNGMIRHGLRWQYPADVILQKTAEDREIKEKEFAKKMKLWRTWMKGRKPAEGRAQFLALRTPWAVSGLSKLLEEEESAEFKKVYIQALRNIGAEAGSMAFIREVLETQNPSLHSLCLDALREIGTLRATTAFSAHLKDSSNRKVNRAAVGLAALDAKDAVPELIDALTTKHKFKKGSGSQGSIAPTFSNNGGGGLGGFSMGGGAKVVELDVKNESVRDALVKLTGVNHGFNKEAWRLWLVRTNTPVSTNLRRSE